MNKNFTLNQRRDFGDALGDGVTFLKMHFKPLFSIFLTYVVPLMMVPIVLLVATGSISEITEFYSIENMTNPNPDPFAAVGVLAILFGFMLFYLLAYLVLNLAVYSAYLCYEENGNVLAEVDEIKDKMRENFGNYLISALTYFAIMVIAYIALVVFFALGAFMGVAVVFILVLISFPLFVWLFNCLSSFSFIRMREQLSVSDGLKRSFYLIKKNWWSMFGVVLISSIAAGIASYVFSIPFYIATFVGASSMSEGDGMTSFAILTGFGFLIYMLGSLFLQKYVTSCTVLKYFDMVEQRDGSSVAAQIDQLGQSNDSYFENEGEY